MDFFATPVVDSAVWVKHSWVLAEKVLTETVLRKITSMATLHSFTTASEVLAALQRTTPEPYANVLGIFSITELESAEILQICCVSLIYI